ASGGRPMIRKTTAALLAATAMTAGLAACAYNETLGRSQLLIVDDAALQSSADAAWSQAMRTMNPTNNAAQNQRVRTVGSRIVAAANLSNRLSWDYAVFQNDTPNAFTLPNGKIGVTTGLLNLVQNDDQLAA